MDSPIIRASANFGSHVFSRATQAHFLMTVVKTPGELLGAADEFKAGEGVYECNGLLRASIVGIEQRIDPENEVLRSRHFKWQSFPARSVASIEGSCL